MNAALSYIAATSGHVAAVKATLRMSWFAAVLFAVSPVAISVIAHAAHLAA
jgi:hypothetical protein